MRNKIIGIIFCMLLIITAVFPIATMGNKSDIDNEKMLSIKINSYDFGGVSTINDWVTVYENDFEQMAWNDSGAFGGPNLWHLTSVDSWSGDSCMGCFNQGNHYENDMDFNYVLSPILNMEDVEEMFMDFYFKFITEDEDDHWGIVIFDPATNEYLSHIWKASQTWKRLPYETYGYHPNWVGLMNPMGEYQSFDVKSAYGNWYSEGYFRNSNGSRSYDLQIGFVFYESDESGYTNDIAEMHGDYWSGLFIDDVLIRQLVFNGSPETPGTPSGPTSGNTGNSYSYSTSTTDPDGDTVKYGWDWNDDEIVDEWTGQNPSGAIVSTGHSWTTTGTYYVKVKAEDSNGAQSDFSSPLAITITSGENHPPDKPSIEGTTSGKAGVSYDYTISSVDPDGDNIYYYIEWFEGCPGINWDGPFLSGEEIIRNNSWDKRGTYTIRVQAKDEYGATSEWTSIVISMPKFISFNSINHYYKNFNNIFTVNQDGNNDQFDQQQLYSSGYSLGVFGEPAKLAQSFKPTLEILTRVQVRLRVEGFPDGLMISIHDDLNGPDLASLYIPYDEMSINDFWVEFNFRDIVVSPEKTYYIVWDPVGSPDNNNTFYWYYRDNNPYERGSMWKYLSGNWDIQSDLDFCFITYGMKHAPNHPIITGPTSGITDKELIFNFSATDLDEDNLFYYIDWGDGQVEDWFGPYYSGKEIAVSHSWNEPEIYDIRAKVKDEHDVESDWSEPFMITFLNGAPDKPERPSGPTNGKTMQSYSYSTSSGDPDEHRIKYGWDWDGDDEIDLWTDYYPSGQTVSETNVWDDQGTYEIKVKAMDEYGLESDWSDSLEVSMPINKEINTLFLTFLENHPNLFPLLQSYYYNYN